MPPPPELSSSGHAFAMRKYSTYTDDSGKNEETFRQSCGTQYLPLSLSFFPSSLGSASERLARFLAPRRFVYFLYIRRSFRSATFTLPRQAAVEVFCNPGKDVPHEKIDFTPGRALCHVLKCIHEDASSRMTGGDPFLYRPFCFLKSQSQCIQGNSNSHFNKVEENAVLIG